MYEHIRVLHCVGSDMVDWLMARVEGLADRRDAKKLGAAMLHAGLIRHTVNKTSFSEQCYYVLAEHVLAAGTHCLALALALALALDLMRSRQLASLSSAPTSIDLFIYIFIAMHSLS